MSLSSGARIGVFEVVAKIGEGGMGEVYRARDTRLDRDVALKVLPDIFTRDPERLARFEREAKVLAALNHPHIAQVYGFEPPHVDGSQAAIAMELVEGQTLQALLDSLPSDGAAPGLPLERALAIARQIATALEAAHEQGIIHRDLKPANVTIRDDGTVKVLDFGLAKAFAADAESAQSAVAQSPTLTARATQLGMILGTAAYMSPEQARGRSVDRRADVWAFGVVLFEMLAGRRAFDGDDVSDVLASVLKTDPDWTLLPPDLPPPVRRLLRRCLEKDPKKRLRDIGEGMLQLDEGLASGATSSGVMPAQGGVAPEGRVATGWWRTLAPIALTAVVTAAAAGAIGMMRSSPPPPPAPTFRAQHVPHADAPITVTVAYPDVALSPDGRTFAYPAGNGRPNLGLYIRRFDQLEAAPVRGTQPGISPFFSPDGQWIGFVDQTAQEQIRKVPVLGGTPTTVVRAGGTIMGTCWTGNEILFGVRDGPLFSVNESGGEASAITSLDTSAGEGAHGWPSAVPGTSIVIFAIQSEGGTGGSDMTLAAVDRATGAVTRFGLEGSRPRYLAAGRIVYATRDGVLYSVAFDAGRMAITGAPVPVLEGVGIKAFGGASFDLTASGHLVYTEGTGSVAPRTIAWVDRGGRETSLPVPTRSYFYARVSPGGSRLSLDLRDEEEDVWIWDLKREVLSRLTDDPGADQYGLWTPDEHIITASTIGGRLELFRRRPDGIGQAERLTDTSADRLVPFPNAVTPDGRMVIFRAVGPDGKNDLLVAEIGGDRTVRKLIASQHDETNAAVSPDGAYVAFESDMTGNRREVFVRPFPDVDAGQLKVSTDGGRKPLWSPDGREIFYLANDRLMAVPVTRSSGRIELGKPVALFETRSYFFGGQGRNYDIDPSGQRFVMVKNAVEGPARPMPITIVLNWGEELRARIK